MLCSVLIISTLEPVCPRPDVLIGTRTVGSVNNVTCPPGEFGGGTATCNANLAWSNDISPCRCKHHHCHHHQPRQHNHHRLLRNNPVTTIIRQLPDTFVFLKCL